MSARPNLGPKPLLGYTANHLARVAERRGDAAFLAAREADPSAAAMAVGGELIVLKRDSAALRLIQTIDEETDRFAKNYHRSLRTKSALTSTLEEIPGIGPKRRQALMKAFGSLDGIRAATVEQLSAVPGMTKKSAEELKGLL
jgi:excinuclease UvrABC nuclease subunit